MEAPVDIPSFITTMRSMRSAPRDAESEPIDVLAILKEWSQREDAPKVVRESCIVAVDMWEVCIVFTGIFGLSLVALLYLPPCTSTKTRTSFNMLMDLTRHHR